jgi:uncharacterized protein YlxP (DUF503 family)
VIIGLLVLDMHFPQARSLKDKRQVLNRIKGRIEQKHNVALAELDFQDKWQRAQLGLVTISNDRSVVDNTLNRIREDAESTDGAQVLGANIQYL